MALFEIGFNDLKYDNDKFLIDKLGAKYVPTGSNKYPPFEVLKVEVKDFEQLEKMLEIVDKELGGLYSAVISFDSPTIYFDNKI